MKLLKDNPVTIRFLDPPLHEFVPTEEDDIKKLADAQGKTVEEIKTIIAFTSRIQPYDGTQRTVVLQLHIQKLLRCRLRLLFVLLSMYRRSIHDWTVKPEIMIPLVM